MLIFSVFSMRKQLITTEFIKKSEQLYNENQELRQKNIEDLQLINSLQAQVSALSAELAEYESGDFDLDAFQNGSPASPLNEPAKCCVIL